MNRHRTWRTSALLGALLLAVANPTHSATKDGRERPGMGESEEQPQGAPFSLPEGLILEEPIQGYNPQDPIDCDDKEEEEGVGQGALVELCLILTNTTDAPITLELPPGLIFISKDLKIQNGIIAQTVKIEVPAGQRYFTPLFLYCVNLGRAGSNPQSYHVLGPVNTDADFKELFDLLKDKEVDRFEAGHVQGAVRHLSEGEGLRATDRRNISNM